MTEKLPAWAIAQALQEWRDAIPKSRFREEVRAQVMARAREILGRPTVESIGCGGCAPPVFAPIAIDPLAVLRGDHHASIQDVCRAWLTERANGKNGMEHAP